MGEFGKWLVLLGILLAAIGALLSFLPKIPWLGNLPGDIYIRKDSFSFYFPLTTCLLISFILTLVLYLFRR